MNLSEAFAVLDISPEAAETEIDAAYKAAVQAWHPDRFARTPHMQGIAEAKLKRLNEAYSVLCAPREPVHARSAANYVDDRVLYQGFDPRLRMVGQNEPAGRPAETHILDRMLVLVTRRGGVFTRVTEYPYETILRIAHGETRWQSPEAASHESQPHAHDIRLCVLEATVPDGPQRRALVSLTFRDEQAAARFARQMMLALERDRRGPQATPPTHSSRDAQRQPAAARPVVLDHSRSPQATPPAGYAHHRPQKTWSGWLAGLSAFLLGSLAIAAAAVLPWPPLPSREVPLIAPIPEPELVVWTEPAAPAPHQPYEVCIRLQLPPGVLPPDDVYSPVEDLLLVASASDGTTSYETFKYVPPVTAPGGQAEIRIPAPILDTDSNAGESLEVYSRLIGRWVRLTVRAPHAPDHRSP